MKAVVQRVKEAHVVVEGRIVGAIDNGLLVLLGVGTGDGDNECRWLAEKIANMRIFSDENGKMSLSVKDLKQQILVVSQFTLYGNCLTGRRPDFLQAASPEIAKSLYSKFVVVLENLLGYSVPTGSFGDKMEVHMVGDGPVTLLIETKAKKKNYR